MQKIQTLEINSSWREKISQHPLFTKIGQGTLVDRLGDCALVQVESGITVIREGEYDSRFYILISGFCDVLKSNKNEGRTVSKTVEPDHVLSILKAGDFFGEMSCMSPWPRNTTVMTSGQVVLLEVEQSVFDLWMDSSEPFREVMNQTYLSRGLLTLMRSIDAFSILSDSALHSLLEGVTLDSFKSGEVVLQEGDHANDFYVIRGGAVSVKRDVAGEDKIINYLRSGNFFGEMALLNKSLRSATISAMGRVELVKISRERFLNAVDADPKGADLLRQAVSKRMKSSEETLNDDNMLETLNFMAEQGILQGGDALVVDLAKCIHCGNCEEACLKTNGQSLITLHGPSFRGHLFPTACRNCDDPQCLIDCKVNAITRKKSGEIQIADHCVGCTKCAQNCPYETIMIVPAIQEQAQKAQQLAGLKALPKRRAMKCHSCKDVQGGPQCVLHCPTAAIHRHNVDDLAPILTEKRS